MLVDLITKALNVLVDKEKELDHDKKPKSNFFNEKKTGLDFAATYLNDSRKTFNQGFRLGSQLREELKTFNYPDGFKEELLTYITKLGKKSRLFPDMDSFDIWYTDYYELIVCAETLGLGDYNLPHWPEESNQHSRYLELSNKELIKLFIAIMQSITNKTDLTSLSFFSVDWDRVIKEVSKRPKELLTVC